MNDLFQGLSAEERNMIKISSIMGALGIEGSQAHGQLLSYFVKEGDLDEAEAIPRHEVINALKRFVSENRTKIQEGNSNTYC